MTKPIILTDKEIEAIELSIVKRLDLDAIYTLRNLLERIKDIWKTWMNPKTLTTYTTQH